MDQKLLDRSEHAKWIQKKNAINRQYVAESNKIFNDSAARGFSVPPANTLRNIISLGQNVKAELSNINGQVYGEGIDTSFQIEEHDLKLAVEYSKIEMALYSQQILNALEIEVANMNDLFARQKADIDKEKTRIDLRQKDLILQKAEQDRRITDYKIEMVDVERSTLDKDIELLEAKIETAEMQLTIIDSLREVIAAEQLIVAAEQRKAEAIEILLVVETEIAAIKESMIPYYQDLADAKSQLADAIKQEAYDKMEMAKLQIQRAQLKIDQANDFATEQNYEGSIVDAQTNYNNTVADTRLYQNDAQKILSEKQSEIKRELITLTEELKKRDIDIDFDYKEKRKIIEDDSTIEKYNTQINTNADTLDAQLSSMEKISDSKVEKIKASGRRSTKTSNRTTLDQRISSS